MSSKMFLKLLLGTMFVAVLFFFKVHIASQVKYLSKEKNLLQDSIHVEQGKFNDLKFNDYQKFTAKERVVKFAVDSLGLEIAERPFEVLYIEENKIKQIERIVNRRYE